MLARSGRWVARSRLSKASEMPVTRQAPPTTALPRTVHSSTPASPEEEERRFHLSGSIATDRKSTRLNSSHGYISYAVFCLKKKKKKNKKSTTSHVKNQ